MRIQVVKTKNELRSLETQWNEMTRDSRFGAPFYSWFWFERWWEHFGNGHELFIIYTVDDDGRILALAPFMKAVESLRGIPTRVIRFMDNAIGPRNSILFRENETAIRSIRAIFEFLLLNRHEWDMMNLRSMDSEMPYLSILSDMKRFYLIRKTKLKSLYIKIRKDFKTYMAETFKAKQRRSRKRSLNKVAKEGTYYINLYQHHDEIQWALEETFRVSKASWKGDLGTDMASSEAARLFYTEVTDHFALSNQVGIWILNLNDRSIAAQYHLIHKDTVYFLINDFDKAYQRISPGSALLYHVIEKFHEDTVREFHFGGHDMEYKMKWATDFIEHHNIQIFSNMAFSHFLYITKNTILPGIRKLIGLTRILNTEE